MLASHKGEIPFVVLLIPFLLGIGAGLVFNAPNYKVILTIIFFVLAVAYVGLNITYRVFNLHRWRAFGGALLHTVVFTGGCACLTAKTDLNNDWHFSKLPSTHLLVQVSNEPILKNNLLRFTAKVLQTVGTKSTTPATGTLMLSVWSGDKESLNYGDRLIIPASYKPVNPPFNPAEFNYKRYLANQNIYHQCFLQSGDVQLLSSGNGNAAIAYALRLRKQLVQKLKLNMRDTNAVAVASTLLLGYKADLSSDILQAYSKTGAIHVLSVSGAHVAIVLVLIELTLGFMNRFRHGRVVKAVITIGLIWAYALLTGFSPAVCRAAVMITLFITGKTYARHINGLNILAISAFFLLLYNPFYITDVGFQLSYLAMFGLITVQPIIYKLWEVDNKWAHKLWVLCSASIAIQLVTFPLSAYNFHQFPVYFLISNLLILLPTLVIMYSGLFCLLLPKIPWLSAVLWWVFEQTILWLNKVLGWIEHLPYASIGSIWINRFEYLVLSAALLLMLYYLYSKKRFYLYIGLAGLLIVVCSTGYQLVQAGSQQHVAFLNLRKHSAFISVKGRQALVITDLMQTDKAYQYSIKPYLDSIKVSGIKLRRLPIDSGDNSALINLYGRSAIIINTSYKPVSIAKRTKVDFVIVTASPQVSVALLNEHFDYKMLVIDANNSDRQVQRFVNEARSMKVNFYCLKRNKALVIPSK